MGFSYYSQFDGMDCGAACLRMVAKHYGRQFTLRTLSHLCGFNREGISLLGLSQAAESIKLRATGVKLNTPALRQTELPCILHWRLNHFVVLYKIRNNTYFLADPASGMRALGEDDFNNSWISDKDNNIGVALILSPTPEFYKQKNDPHQVRWSLIFRYFTIYRKLFSQVLLGLSLGSLMQLVAPFLTQSIVDVGINEGNISFIYLIVIAQAMLIIGRTTVDFIRSWILLHISTRINISILTDFLIKLMKLPMSFFDAKMTGDIMQRIGDQKRIETFLTSSTLTTFFSLFNLLVFSAILAWYNIVIFGVFIAGNSVYIIWIVIFLERRRQLNYKNFEIGAKNQSTIVQLVIGMQEIKLNDCEQQKRWEWEHLQARQFKFNVKNLALSQYQQGGATFINEGTNLLITFLSAKAVVDGYLTLGGMMALQYIIGQANMPIQQLLGFIQNYQDAKISLERLNEIHEMEDEEPENKPLQHALPINKSISIQNLTFKYPGAGNDAVINHIDLEIPQGKITAIVGMSGSGKTTILKLLLRFYEIEKGQVKVGGQPLNNFSFKVWRKKCGVVMQDGFIFSDTIERNIAVGKDEPDKEKLQHAIKVANIQDLVDELPLGLNTKIGAEGNGISQGQRQRILIARAVYKDPEYIFFDEATNALDANNERIIMENLKKFFASRTVVIVAHRLSTVSNADNIVVLEKGHIIEQGTHHELTSLKGNYYKLVKNQLELGA